MRIHFDQMCSWRLILFHIPLSITPFRLNVHLRPHVPLIPRRHDGSHLLFVDRDFKLWRQNACPLGIICYHRRFHLAHLVKARPSRTTCPWPAQVTLASARTQPTFHGSCTSLTCLVWFADQSVSGSALPCLRVTEVEEGTERSYFAKPGPQFLCYFNILHIRTIVTAFCEHVCILLR